MSENIYAGYPHCMPDVSQLSKDECALAKQIVALYRAHKTRIGREARLKSRPELDVLITSVYMSDYGIPRFDIEVIRLNGKPLQKSGKVFSVAQRLFLQFPSSAFSGELEWLT